MGVLSILGQLPGTTTTIKGTDTDGMTVTVKREGLLTGNLESIKKAVVEKGKVTVQVKRLVEGSRDATATHGNKEVSGEHAGNVMDEFRADEVKAD